jgi:lauroyl/myristoyl acyltransferase
VSALLYRAIAQLSRLLGLWIVRVTGAIIAAAYYLFLPRRTCHSVRCYRALFPERSRFYAFCCAWRQYQDFARVYSERLEIDRRTDVRFDREGDEYLAQAHAAGRGVILAMSHFGRWEIGARLLARRQAELTLVMGGQTDGGARAGVDRDLRRAGVGVVTIPDGQGQAVDILQAVRVLRQGGIVSLAADRARGDARVLYLPFLGHTAAVAAAPFALALVSGAPLLFVFALRIGPRHYRVVTDPPITLTTSDRRDRQAVLAEAAAAYLQRLHAMVKAYPEQWQTFGRFLQDAEQSG